MRRAPVLRGIATRRLRLAPLARRDAAALRVITNDAAVIGAIHFLAAPFTLGDARRLARGDVHGVQYFLGVWRKDRRLVGVVGLGLSRGDIEIGYWFGPRHHRRGYAREALGAVLRALEHRRVVAECRRENAASWRLLLWLGFTPANAPGTRPGRDLLIRGRARAVPMDRDSTRGS